MKHVNKQIGENIFRIRTSKHISQEWLADSAGMALGSVGHYEKGKFDQKIGQLYKIAEALEVTIYDILFPVEEVENLRKSNGSIRPVNAEVYIKIDVNDPAMVGVVRKLLKS